MIIDFPKSAVDLTLSPFTAPWILPIWHDRIVLGETVPDCIIHGRVLTGVCWLWTGWANGKGHPKVGVKRRATYLHRLSLAAFLGIEIWQLDKVDHLCRIRPCFNPRHLEDVTQQENFSRGNGGLGRPKEECPLGDDELQELLG